MSHNVVILNFSQTAHAYQALSELKQASADQQVTLHYAAVAQRSDGGELEIKDATHDSANEAKPVTGTLIGSLVGMLAGPVGVALGAASGAIIGSVMSENQVYDRMDVLEAVGASIPPGATSVMAVVEESTPHWMDALAVKLGAGVARRPLEQVEAELAAKASAQFARAKAAIRNDDPVV